MSMYQNSTAIIANGLTTPGAIVPDVIARAAIIANGLISPRAIVPDVIARTADCLHLLPTFKSVAPWSRVMPKGRSSALVGGWDAGAPGIALEVKFEEMEVLTAHGGK